MRDLTADQLKANIDRILSICEVQARPCNLCKTEIHFLRTGAGNLMPFDSDGTPHWATCPYAGSFRKGTPLKQEQLFDAAPLPE